MCQVNKTHSGQFSLSTFRRSDRGNSVKRSEQEKKQQQRGSEG